MLISFLYVGGKPPYIWHHSFIEVSRSVDGLATTVLLTLRFSRVRYKRPLEAVVKGRQINLRTYHKRKPKNANALKKQMGMVQLSDVGNQHWQ